MDRKKDSVGATVVPIRPEFPPRAREGEPRASVFDVLSDKQRARVAVAVAKYANYWVYVRFGGHRNMSRPAAYICDAIADVHISFPASEKRSPGQLFDDLTKHIANATRRDRYPHS